MAKIPITRDLRGNVVSSIHDLPPADTIRWTPNKKATVVKAVIAGIVSLQEVLGRYHMTGTEFEIWKEGLQTDGADGLKTTHYQRRRRKCAP